MNRRNDYEVRLMDLAAREVGKPFEWGKTNCAALAAAAVDAMFGTELFTKSISARCTSAARGLALSRRRETRETLLALGASLIDPAFRQVADIIVAFDDPWECCHIILGRTCLTSSPEKGVFIIPTALILKATSSQLSANSFRLEVFRCL